MPNAGTSTKEVEILDKYPPGLLSRCPQVDIVNHKGCGSCRGVGTVLPKPRMHADLFERNDRRPLTRKSSSIF